MDRDCPVLFCDSECLTGGLVEVYKPTLYYDNCLGANPEHGVRQGGSVYRRMAAAK